MAQRVLNRAIGTNGPCRKTQHILFERLLFKLLDIFETFCLVALHISIYEWCPGHRAMRHIYVQCRELVGSRVSHPGCTMTTFRMKAAAEVSQGCRFFGIIQKKVIQIFISAIEGFKRIIVSKAY